MNEGVPRCQKLETLNLKQPGRSWYRTDGRIGSRTELASRALARIQQCLEKAEDQHHKISASGALTKEQEAQLRESFHVQIKSEIAKILAPLHPADIAYILEALPTDDRLIVWDLVRNNQDGDVLVEVNDSVRETLIDAMDREELVDAMETLDTDEIADLVEDLPTDVVAEVQEGLTTKERAQLRAAMSYPKKALARAWILKLFRFVKILH